MTISSKTKLELPSIDYVTLREKTSPKFVELVIARLGKWKLVNFSGEWLEHHFDLYIVCTSILFVFHFNKENGLSWHQEMYRDEAAKLIKLSGGLNDEWIR